MEAERNMGCNLAAKAAAASWPETAEQTWHQGEVIDLGKSSGNFPFQRWALSATDLQVSVRKIYEAD